MKSPRILATTVVALLASLSAHAVNYSSDTVAGDGAAITPGSGIWDLTVGNLIWNNARHERPLDEWQHGRLWRR